MSISFRSHLLAVLSLLVIQSAQGQGQSQAQGQGQDQDQEQGQGQKVPSTLAGVYAGAEGAELTLLPAGENAFKVVYRRTPSAIEWEGYGFYAPGCKCIQVVYSYASNSGQNHGVATMQLEVRGGSGKIVATRGGWGVSDSSMRRINSMTKTTK